jgi:GT2 family glycosyltransferase
MPRVHIAFFTTGYPYVDAAVRAVELSRRHGAGFSRSIGEPFSLRRDQFARWFLETDNTHALLLDGDVVPPEDALERLLDVDAPIATAAYPQWIDDRLHANVQTADAWSEVVPPTRFPVRRCLLGCVLVHRDAFAAIAPPWFMSTMTATRFISDDEWFCARAAQAGQTIVCDGAVMCASLRQGTNLLVLAGRDIARPERG